MLIDGVTQLDRGTFKLIDRMLDTRMRQRFTSEREFAGIHQEDGCCCQTPPLLFPPFTSGKHTLMP
jgi:hypothetical protein